jgi:hypothetical protein
MTTTGADASAVTAEQITEIAQEVWESFLGSPCCRTRSVRTPPA